MPPARQGSDRRIQKGAAVSDQPPTTERPSVMPSAALSADATAPELSDLLAGLGERTLEDQVAIYQQIVGLLRAALASPSG